ncbi:efflux RND transporter permease subunit [Streptomyces sp. RB6PN25]|uniref:Efflux RND transporter permease subunit n=1 Tax=Streptomyces humicola TaxID=2953240 RepID=A0ABT1Q2D2_9ACTN|nr:efflux RND transporter permease subunit [Streptomyces humicola]MCQ4084091.1 efflux RND transporter permease subunit [Streptomyces humicola]
MHSVFAAIGRFSVRFRWPVVVLWIAATIAAAHFLPSLSSVTQNNNTNFLPASAPSQHAASLATPLEPSGTVNIPVVVARSSGQLSSADTDAINRLQKELAAEPTVSKVKDVGRAQDGQAEQLQVVAGQPAKGGSNQQQADETLVDNLRSAVSKASMPGDLQTHLAGQIAANVDNSKQGGKTGNQMQMVSMLLIVVLLLLVFRALLAPLVTLLPAVLVVTMAGPLVAEAAKHGLNVSSLAQEMLIILVLGAGTDYGLFLVFRVREELRAGLPPKEAVAKAVARVGESITFSAGTVIAALLSLLAASFGIYSNLGYPLAIGIGLMLLAGLTLLPALLAILGRAVFWPSKIRPGVQKVGLWGRISGAVVQRPVATLTAGLLLFGGLAYFATGYSSGGFGGSTSAPSGSDAAAGQTLLAQHFPRTAANPTQVVFQLPKAAWDDPGVLATAQQKLQSASEFKDVTGPLDPNGLALTPSQYTELHTALGPAQDLPPAPPGLTAPKGAGAATVGKERTALAKAAAAGQGATARRAPLVDGRFTVSEYEAYRATASYVSADGRTVQYSTALTAGDASSTAAMNAVPSIRAQVADVAKTIGATDNGVVGQAPGLYDVSNTSNNDMKSVIPIAIAVIGVLLALVMRSLVAPLYLIVSVGLSYLAALGLSVLLFIKLGHSGGLVFILPFLMFIFLLALGEDYNILVMTRIREEAHDLPLREAVKRALNATGTTVTSAGLVLAGTFAVFAIVGGSSPNGSQMRDIGAGLALGILMDTFLVRTLLVPSTVVLLGRWNWWPSTLRHQNDFSASRTTSPEAVTAMAGTGTGGDTGSDTGGIRGRVLDGAGSPVASAAVTLIDAQGRQHGRTASDGDGRYRIDAPGAGMYVLIGSAASRRPQATEVSVDHAPVELDLVLSGATGLTGSVREADDGGPLPGALVVATNEHGEVVASSTADGEGEFELVELLPGVYTLAVSAARHRPAALPVEVVQDAADRHEILLERLHFAVGQEPRSR